MYMYVDLCQTSAIGPFAFVPLRCLRVGDWTYTKQRTQINTSLEEDILKELLLCISSLYKVVPELRVDFEFICCLLRDTGTYRPSC